MQQWWPAGGSGVDICSTFEHEGFIGLTVNNPNTNLWNFAFSSSWEIDLKYKWQTYFYLQLTYLERKAEHKLCSTHQSRGAAIWKIAPWSLFWSKLKELVFIYFYLNCVFIMTLMDKTHDILHYGAESTRWISLIDSLGSRSMFINIRV